MYYNCVGGNPLQTLQLRTNEKKKELILNVKHIFCSGIDAAEFKLKLWI